MSSRVIRVSLEKNIELLVQEVITATEKEIILECPSETLKMLNGVNLRLLKFYAEEKEKELLIQSENHHLIELAQGMGIKTIGSIGLKNNRVDDEPVMMITNNNNDDYPIIEVLNDQLVMVSQEQQIVPHVENSRAIALPGIPRLFPKIDLQHQGGLLLALAVSVFTLAVAFWWFLQPRVTILVYPKEEELDLKVHARISPEFNENQIAQRMIPAEVITKEGSITVQLPTTGLKKVGVSEANGKITFINSTTQVVVVPKGTIIYDRNNIQFVTQANLLVPKKTMTIHLGISFGENYGRADVGIVALEKGEKGNLLSRKITNIQGNLARTLKAINFSPTKNGTDKQVPVVTQEDILRAETEARNQMKLIANDEIRAQVGQKQLFLPELVKLEVTKIANEPKQDVESEKLQTRLHYRTTATVVSMNAIYKFLSSEQAQIVPANFKLLSKKIKLLSVSVMAGASDQQWLILSGRGWIRGIMDESKIRQLIKGKEVEEARTLLLKQEEIANCQISMKSGKQFPKYDFQIKVVFPNKTNAKL